MRTIKASEVVKGMRVRVEVTQPDLKTIVEGKVVGVTPGATAWLTFADDETFEYGNDHPVTVLAEPEPEWVEGAWYALDVGGHRRPGRRVGGGWSSWADGPTHGLSDDDELTVLGRVLIVDWPGDDVARDIERHGTSAPIRFVSALLDKFADAIRTQGGVR